MSSQPPFVARDRFEVIADPAVAMVARRIAAYWLAQPEACDTAKGIREWWLEAPVADHLVRQALKELTNLGVVTTDVVGEGQAERYRLAASVDELRLWLAPEPGRVGGDGRLLPH